MIAAVIEHGQSGKAERTRVVRIEVGREFEVQPPNPQKLKHRGRRCTVVGWVFDDIGFLSAVSVKFADNGRRGRVDLEDLVEVSPAPAN